MTAFEITISIIGFLSSAILTIGTIYIGNLRSTLRDIDSNVNGIKVEIGKIVTTQAVHEKQFDKLDKRVTELEEKI